MHSRQSDPSLVMTIDHVAKSLARQLGELGVRIVFAESCTAGLVSATLARVPGISEWHCGSAVVYREQTKEEWLDVPRTQIDRFTAVSDTIARRMAVGVLAHTPEAHIAASVTGHLGPDAPHQQDGIIYVGFARRQGDRIADGGAKRYALSERTRLKRQKEAVAIVLNYVVEMIA